MTREDPLVGGREHPGDVVRIGDTVRRPTGPWTPTVHAFLRHLRGNGFTACPEPLGIDEQGREILTYLPGTVLADPDWDGGPTPWPEDVRSDDMLVRLGTTIRQLHDASRGFVPPEERPWRQWTHPLGPGQIVCHSDLGHWNTVHGPDGSVAFIDWDSIRPDDPGLDWAAVAWSVVPLADDDFLRGTGWEEPPDIAARLRLFADASSVRGPDEILTLLHRAKERHPERFRWWPISPADSASLLRGTADELDWLSANGAWLRAALR
jgi:hypothetical protein